jgi:hypothetical protein
MGFDLMRAALLVPAKRGGEAPDKPCRSRQLCSALGSNQRRSQLNCPLHPPAPVDPILAPLRYD